MGWSFGEVPSSSALRRRRRRSGGGRERASDETTRVNRVVRASAAAAAARDHSIVRFDDDKYLASWLGRLLLSNLTVEAYRFDPAACFDPKKIMSETIGLSVELSENGISLFIIMASSPRLGSALIFERYSRASSSS